MAWCCSRPTPSCGSCRCSACCRSASSAETDPESGAPLTPMLGRKALLATGISAVLWVLFYVLIAFKVLDL
ncbi:MAG: DUF1467 family protein [Rhizomicrobium sp.]